MSPTDALPRTEVAEHRGLDRVVGLAAEQRDARVRQAALSRSRPISSTRRIASMSSEPVGRSIEVSPGIELGVEDEAALLEAEERVEGALAGERAARRAHERAAAEGDATRRAAVGVGDVEHARLGAQRGDLDEVGERQLGECALETHGRPPCLRRAEVYHATRSPRTTGAALMFAAPNDDTQGGEEAGAARGGRY